MSSKRILHIVSAMDRGGAEMLIMCIYRNLDRKKVQFDFITHGLKKGDFEEEIKELGGRIYKIPSIGEQGPIGYLKDLIQIMRSDNFLAVHSHTDYQSGIPTLAAKLCGIKHRICHSHSNNWLKGSKIKDKIYFNILKYIIRFSATKYCSCSMEAAEFLFGNKKAILTKVKILKNGIDISLFKNINDESRDNLISELNLPKDVKIIGHVGKFSESKNQFFILKILKKLLEEDERFRVLLVGDGPLKEQIEKEAYKLGISKYVRFLGVREDIPRLMNLFDVFIFPSLFEGFGIVTIEAQCAGTPCVISDKVPKSTDMGLGLAKYIPLNANISIWCSSIKESLLYDRPEQLSIHDQVSKRGYNIRDNISDWINLYEVNS